MALSVSSCRVAVHECDRRLVAGGDELRREFAPLLHGWAVLFCLVCKRGQRRTIDQDVHRAGDTEALVRSVNGSDGERQSIRCPRSGLDRLLNSHCGVRGAGEIELLIAFARHDIEARIGEAFAEYIDAPAVADDEPWSDCTASGVAGKATIWRKWRFERAILDEVLARESIACRRQHAGHAQHTQKQRLHPHTSNNDVGIMAD